MVDIVVINWNAGDLLARCVHSVLQTGNRNLVDKLFIVDNFSSDNSINLLPVDEKIIIIRNTANLGFAKACNQAFRQCSSTFTLLLNPDAVLKDNTISECITFMQNKPGVSIMGCRLLNDKGNTAPSCARFPKPLNIFYDAAGLSKLWPGLFKPATLMTDWDHLESKHVDQVMGAFMFMRTSVFKSIGYFDERYFVYFEELDFSKKLADNGGVSFYNNEISITHTGGGTTSGVKAFRLYLFLNSRLLYSKKHFGLF